MNPFRFHTDNLDDILFEHRNKEYGAYELRKSHDARVIKSFLTALCLLTFLIGAPILIHRLFFMKAAAAPTLYTTTPVEMKNNFEIVQNKIQQPSIPDPPSPKPPDVSAYAAVTDSLLKKQDYKKDSLLNTNVTQSLASVSTSDTTQGTGQRKPIIGSGKPNDLTTASATPFNLATLDKPPLFPGGEAAMLNFLQNNIRYNARAREEKIAGRVYASFIVNSKGEVEAIKILHSLGYGLDEEVVRVLGSMPKWKPGSFQGTSVSTIMNIPVSFNIIQ